MRTSRRLSLLVLLVFTLVTAVPTRAIPQEHTGFPMAWLWNLLSVRPSWAGGLGPAPQQPGAAATDVGHYVTDDSTRSTNGTGRKPVKAPGELDPYTPHNADRKVVTGPQRQGFDESSKVRVPEASSATSTMWRDANGTYARQVFQEPVNYRAADGTWQPIDTTFKRDSGGRWETTANSLKVSVAGGAAGQASSTVPTDSGHAMTLAASAGEDLVTMTLPTGEVIGYSLQDATLASPTVTAGSALYANALPQTDVRIDALAEASKETLILHAASAPTSWVYPLNLQGVGASIADNGEVVFTNDAGVAVARMPRGFVKDSSFNPQSGDAAYSHSFTYELITVDGQPAVKASVDVAWLADPARVFPVYVDPELRLDTDGDTYVMYGDDTDHSGEDNLAVGTWDSGTHRGRALMHFGDFQTTYAGKRLSYVTANLFLTWQFNCTAQSFTVHAVNAAWAATSVRWGSSTTYGGPALGPSLGSASPNSSAACGNTGGNRATGSWVPVILDVAEFNDWATGGANNGLAVMSSDTNSVQFKRFTSRNGPLTCGSRACAPYIYAIYSDDVAAQVDARYPANNGVVSSLTPELLTTAHDPDSWPGKGLKYFYQVYSDTGTPLFNSGWITTPAWTVPTGKLSWGKTYLYAVQVDDYSKQSAISPAYAFSVPVPQPVITSGLSPNGTKGYDASVGNYTTSATDATVAVAGPPLTITREYNSLSMRSRNAFGAGWSSIADMRATQSYDASGAVETVVVTYPNGQEAAFGRSGTTYTPPSGRFATFTQTTDIGGNVTGYVLTDKDGTVYTFAQIAVGEWPTVYRISSITDANGRKQTFTYDTTTGYLTTIAGAAGTGAAGRALHLEWAVPTGSNYPHVTKVYTDPATTGDATSALTWTYDYTVQDRLTQVCPPTTNGGCTSYTYQWLSQHGNVVLNNNPYSYWRLGESAGTTAASSVLANAGTDNGTYTNVTLGGTDRPWSQGPTAAQFTGSNSYVQLPGKLVAAGAYQSISMWFRTTTPGGVLFSYSASPITAGTTASNYTPALYIDANGYLRGEFWQGASTPMKSTAPVTDDTWHHVVLSGAGSTQTLYLDGAKQGTSLAGTIAPIPNGTAYEYIGAGFLGNGWPDHANTGASPAPATYFTGKISEVAFFNKAISNSAAQSLFLSGRWSSTALTKITRPTGKVTAQVAYDTVTGRVTTVTDENGGAWTVGTATVGGDSDVYVGSVLGAKPVDYWRLTDLGPTDAVNEVAGNTASYNTVTLGETGSGRFADTTAAKFNGSTSYVALPAADIPAATAVPQTIELWFKTSAPGVLVGFTSATIGSSQTNYLPALYIGSDNKLHGKFCYCAGTQAPLVTNITVTDGNWHHVVLTRSATAQNMYVDGGKIAVTGTLSASTETRTLNYGYLGTGAVAGWTTPPANTYFTGYMAEVAFYNSTLSAAQATSHYNTTNQTIPVAITMTASGEATVPMPVQTTTVTVPGTSGKTISSSYDLVNGNRMVAQTDALGNATRYGYDVAGYDSVVYDESGARTETGKDVRGNTIRTTTCQRQATNQCNTVYYTYWPDATSTTLTPDPRNDQMTSMRDGRSASATDPTYATIIGYDTAGNRITVTTPPVTGYASGRTTRTDYTTATTAANGGGVTPAGLPWKTTTPGNTVQNTEYNALGDVIKVTDAAGLVTEFAYDGLGRPLSKTIKPDVNDTATWRKTDFAYGKDGQPRQTTDVAVTNHVASASPHQAVTTLTYDDDGSVLTQSVTDATGGDTARVTETTYDAQGHIRTQQDPAGTITTYEYDIFGNTTAAIDHYGNRVENTYDEEGHLLTATAKAVKDDPDSSATRDVVISQNAWNSEGHLAWTKDAKGWTTFSTYYDDGRLDQTIRCTVVNLTDGDDDDTFVDLDDCLAANRYVLSSNSYDGAGNLTTTKSNNDATITVNTYDAANRVTATQADPTGVKRTTTTTYDADDHALNVKVTDNTGQIASSVDRTYDALGRVSSESINNDVADATGWWKLNETSGTVATDSSASGLNGTATNITWSGDNAALNGTSSQIVTSGPAVSTTGSFTVSAWAKLDTLPTDWKTVVSQDGTNVPGFELHYDKEWSRWAFTRHNADNASASSPVRAYANGTATTGVWTHLVGVYDASTKAMSLYVNGSKSLYGATATTALASTGSVRIGSTHMGTNVSNYFPGAIDNVQIYPRALAPAEIETLYSGSGYTRTGKSLQTAKLTTTYTLDKRGLVTKSTDPSGNETAYIYDEAGRLAETRAPQVTVETYGTTPLTTSPTTIVGYNTFGEQVDQQDATGKWTHTTVDAAGRPTSVKVMTPYTAPGTSTPLTSESKTEYDLLGQALTSTDPLGKITTYKYDSLGRTVKVIDAKAGVATAAYDDLGNITQTIDPAGGKSGTTYDFLSRPTTNWQDVTKPALVRYTATTDYGTGDLSPWPLSSTTAEGVTTSYAYNNVGELTKTTDENGNHTDYTYDGLGRTIATKLPDLSSRVTTYNLAGQITQVATLDPADAAVTSRTMTYDRTGNMLTGTDARGTVTHFTYDAAGGIVTETQKTTVYDSITTSFGYDANGARTRFTDGRGNPFWTTYNSWGLPESKIEPATTAYPNLTDRTYTSAYDQAGQVVTELNPGGVSITNTYDDLGNLTRQTGAGAEAATVDRVFDYDPASRIKSFTTGTDTTTLDYDDRGMLLSAAGPYTSSTFHYDGDGRTTQRTDAAGTTTYAYNNVGLLGSVANTAAQVTQTYGYNSMSQVSSVTYGTGRKRTFTYNDMHLPATDTLTDLAATTTYGSISYGYDKNGNETSKTTTGFSATQGSIANTYSYDLADRLASWSDGTTTQYYSYDKSGNRTQAANNYFSYDERNRLTDQNGTTSYEYTARGTLSATRSSVTGNQTTVADAFGQIQSQDSTNGPKTYTYDALGRVQRPGFSYTGLDNDLAADGTNSYVRDPDGDLLAEQTGTTKVYAWTDQHTDVVGQFTTTSTTLTGSRNYDPLGKVLSTAGLIGALGYQSEWTDTDTGRVNMLARWYNTDTGQFDTRDTVDGNPTPASVDANRYAYVNDNPLTRTDPTGHCWLCGNPFKKAASFVSNVATSYYHAATAAVSWVSSKVSAAYDYARSGRMWDDIKSGARYAYDKAKKVGAAVVHATVKWVKKKAHAVADAYHKTKNCLSQGAAKCVKHAVKSAAKSVYESAKATVKAIKKDPWKFIATAAVGLAATIAVGALCATGVGCLILAGAVAGAMSAGSGYMVDVARGDQQFSIGGLVGTMVEGGLDGALSAGVSKFTGGVGNKLGLGGLGNKLGITKPGGGLGKASAPGRSFSAENPIKLKGGPSSAFEERANDVPRLQRRAEETHSPLDDIAAKHRDTVVMSTENGPDIHSAGVRDISPAQRPQLGMSDVEARMPGQHAEVTAHETATGMGLQPRALASYPHEICPACREYLELEGYRISANGMSAVMRTFREEQ